MEHFELKKIQVGEEILAYREGGSGDRTLLLIHGNMSSSFFFLPLMEKLAAEFKIYAVDLRGFGFSSYQNRFDDLKELSEDLEFFVEQLRLKELEILGWSTGGGIAMQFAADNPELVKRLILLESVGIMGYPIFEKDAHGQPILTRLLKTKESIANDPIQVAPPLKAIEEQDVNYYKALWKMAIYTQGNLPDASIFEAQMMEALKQKNLVDIDYALTRFNLSDHFNGIVEGSGAIHLIQCPVDIIQSEGDIVVPMQMAEGIQEALGEKATLHVLKSCGHNPMVDDMISVVNIIKNK